VLHDAGGSAGCRPAVEGLTGNGAFRSLSADFRKPDGFTLFPISSTPLMAPGVDSSISSPRLACAEQLRYPTPHPAGRALHRRQHHPKWPSRVVALGVGCWQRRAQADAGKHPLVITPDGIAARSPSRSSP
jgi:hypothetical protein